MRCLKLEQFEITLVVYHIYILTTIHHHQSSASSGGGLFANLTTHKRGSQDYGARRSSVEEMEAKSGAYSSWYNSTFRGMQKVKEEGAEKKAGEERRGVME